jgi:hypothetical protein
MHGLPASPSKCARARARTYTTAVRARARTHERPPAWRCPRPPRGAHKAPCSRFTLSSFAGKRILLLECHRTTVRSFIRAAGYFGISVSDFGETRRAACAAFPLDVAGAAGNSAWQVDAMNWSGHRNGTAHQQMRTLNETLQFVNISNSLTLRPFPHRLRVDFFEYYRCVREYTAMRPRRVGQRVM